MPRAWATRCGNKFDEAKGTAKESYGEATDDESMQAEGKADQAGADLNQGAENVKDGSA